MRVRFLTLGCKVNQYETQALREEFIKRGCELTDSEAFDLCIINTCSVTHRADLESRQLVRRVKRENPLAKIVVCGCLAQLNGDSLKRLGADYIIPQDKKHLVADIVLEKVAAKNGQDLQEKTKDIWSLTISSFFNHRAFIKIQDGCDNFCTFCKVPHIRGRSRSRNPKEVIDEIRRLSPEHREIVICGINLGLYGNDLIPKYTLSTLIADILKIEMLCRLRLSSLEPAYICDRIISFFKNNKLCPHIHFPFQSGDNRILKAMNKNETSELYECVVKKLREVKNDIAISCDIMVGFPGEDEASFQNTVEFVKRVKPMRMHIFRFSPREHTALFGQRVIPNIAKERYAFLNTLAGTFASQYKQNFLGKRLQMITEEYANGYTTGYTENYIKVYLDKKITLGKVVPVIVKEIKNNKALAVLA